MSLASVQKITKIEPIHNADNIELAYVLGWQVVVKKGEFKDGDLCIYIEIDSLLPRTQWSEFLFKDKESTKYRLRTIKLRKQISQGLIIPYSVLPIELQYSLKGCLGSDVSDALGIEKYEKQIPVALRGTIKGIFPTFLRKTDEVRIQSEPELLDKLKGKPFYITQKLDGTSVTYYKYNGVFGVCSRNLELKNPSDPTFHEKKIPFWRIKRLLNIIGMIPSKKKEKSLGIMNIYWAMANKYKIADWLPEGYAIQGEICGPGIQGNKMGLEENELFIFNVFMISNQSFLPQPGDWVEINSNNLLKGVPIKEASFRDHKLLFNYSLEELIEMARDNYSNGTPQEGIVVRSTDQSISFKVVNNEFLLKYGE